MEEKKKLKKFKLLFRDEDHTQNGDWYLIKTVKCENRDRAWEIMANIWDELVENIKDRPAVYRIEEIRKEE
jgi:aminoglycoside/choline kinase family phosphotransferase